MATKTLLFRLPPQGFDLPLKPAAGPKLAKAQPAGRNDPCPCGSGFKVKKCGCEIATGVPRPAHTLSEDAYLAAVLAELMARHGVTTEATDREYIIRSYCRDDVISPARCCDLLEALTRFEAQPQPVR